MVVAVMPGETTVHEQRNFIRKRYRLSDVLRHSVTMSPRSSTRATTTIGEESLDQICRVIIVLKGGWTPLVDG